MAGFDPNAYVGDSSGDFDPHAYVSDDNGPGFMERVLGRLPSTFGNYVPGATPAQASLDNPELTKKIAIAGAGLAGGEMIAPVVGELGGISGAAARVGANTGVGAASQVASNAADNKPLTEDLGKSTLINAGVGVGAEGVSAAATKYGPALMDYAADKAAKAIGMTKADFKRLGPDATRALGQWAMDHGLVGWFSTPAKIEAATDTAKDIAGQRLGEIIDQSQAQLDKMPATGMMPAGKPVQATPVTRGMKLGTPETQSFYPQAPSTVSPDFSSINPGEFTPRRINGNPEPTDAQLAQMSAIGSKAALANVSAANASGFNPYAGPIETEVSTVQPTIERAGPGGDFVTPIKPRPAGSIDAPALAQQLRAKGDAAQLAKVPGAEGLSNQINGFLDTLERNPQDMSLRDAQDLRQKIDAQINWSKKRQDMAGTQEYLVNIRNALSDAINGSVDQAASASGQSLGALKSANSTYSNLSKINDIAANRTAMNSANRAIGLTDTIAGAGGGGAGAMIGGFAGGAPGAVAGELVGNVAGAGINKLARTYGPAIQSNVARVGSNLSPALSGVAKNPVFTQAAIAAAKTNSSNQEPSVSPEMLGDVPKGGPDAWARQGVQNLGLDPNTAARVLADPKGKQLAIQASNFAPKSRALTQIMAQIQKGWGQG